MIAELITKLLLVFYFAVGAAVAGWLIWIFVSVIFLGESSACPQNLCP